MTQHPSANNAFIAACFEIGSLIERLQRHRDEHFGADAERERNWSEVGSLLEVQRRLTETLAFIEGTEA